MKAILHPTQGLLLVPASAITAEDATYPFEDAAPPSVNEQEVAVPGLSLVDGVVRRTWTVQEAPGYNIPVADLLKRLTDQELATWLASAFPGCNLPLASALIRVLAQTALHNKDPRVQAALPGFTALFGAARVAELLRP